MQLASAYGLAAENSHVSEDIAGYIPKLDPSDSGIEDVPVVRNYVFQSKVDHART